ncbi:MAG: hypothetical protein QM804_06965 [Propionicimonas sp.]
MYRWVAEPEAPEADLSQSWPDQAMAEAWLTGAFPELVDAGVTALSLYEEDRLVYGPMSLEP